MIAARYLGWEYPRLQTETPTLKSRKLFPSTSVRRAPKPFSIVSLDNSAMDWIPGAMKFCSSSKRETDLGPGQPVLYFDGGSTVLGCIALLQVSCDGVGRCAATRRKGRPIV